MIPNDPAMLASYINMKLRDDYESLEALCEDLQIDESGLKEKLELGNYFYDKETKRFC